MLLIYFGILLFAGPHVGSLLAPRAFADLQARWGEKAYKGLYSLASLLGIVLMGWGYVQARGDASLYYEPWESGRHILLLLILLAFVLIFSNQSKGYISKFTHHPFSLGIALWSTAHLLANGEKPVVWIFGTMLIISLLDVVLGFSRGQFATHAPNWKHDLRGLIVGVGLYLVFAFVFHPYIIGIPVVR
jgi:uncharacterized membrane protein